MTSTCCNTQTQTTPAGAPRRSLWLAMRRAAHLSRQRRALAALDAHLLADIGCTSQQAQREARRPFWDAPRHWRIQP